MKYVIFSLVFVVFVLAGMYLAASTDIFPTDVHRSAAQSPSPNDSQVYSHDYSDAYPHDYSSHLHSQRDSYRAATAQVAAHLDFARIRDTVYVLGDRFLEVSLPLQRLVVRYRKGDSLVIPISSGNPEVQEAIATPPGIFSVQTKSREAISRQFGNTKMLWWIGFNYNIGLHGLEQNSYYRHLGKRPSSHGCIRTGREDIEKLYHLVDIGVPVIVYDTEPSRVLAFADTATFDTTAALKLGSRSKFMNKLLTKRLEYLYQGTLYERQPYALYMDSRTQLRPGGYAIGDTALLTRPQARPVQLALFAQTQHLPAYWHKDYFHTLQARFDAVQALSFLDTARSKESLRDSLPIMDVPPSDSSTGTTIHRRTHRKHRRQN